MSTIAKSSVIKNGAAGNNPAGGGSPPAPAAPFNKAILGMLLFLSTEVMFFGGLISTFMILRASSEAWPPPQQPLLPVAVTGLNTLLLLISGLTMFRATKSIKTGNTKSLVRWLGMTAILGSVFLVIQGTEWFSLVRYGLTFSSSVYGGTFYALIGCHGLHVLGAVVCLLFVFRNSMKRKYTASAYTGVTLCSMYWYFVVGIWPVLYLLVYLN